MADKLDFLFDKKTLISGADSGNITNKITYVNEKGNLEFINIASIIGINASSTPVELGESEYKEGTSFPADLRLHVQIKSDALPKIRKNAYYVVGEYAQFISDKENLIETAASAANKLGNEIHIVTTLTGLALAASKANKSKVVKVPLSIGLPIEEAKSATEEKTMALKGKHEVTFVDGPYRDRTVVLEIDTVQVNVEGVTSYLALAFNLSNGEIVETDFSDELDEFGIGDLGAGTLDLAVYDENGLNPYKSTNHLIGTNTYIDNIMNSVVELEDFAVPKKRFKKAGRIPKITNTREEFMRKFIKPEIFKSLSQSQYQPVYTVTWMGKKADATEIVEEQMERYAEQVKEKINEFFVNTNIGKVVIVGGGLLFAFKFLKELEEEDCLFPSSLQDSSFFTSKAYLLKNIISQLEAEAQNA